MPLVRHPPEGFFSNVSMSFPVTIDFDKLGLTSPIRWAICRPYLRDPSAARPDECWAHMWPTICTTKRLKRYGVLGEMIKLFLTVTKSPFSDLIAEYVRAQEVGEGRQAPGECFPYYKECPKSIFKPLQRHKYSEQQKGEYYEDVAKEVVRQRLPQILQKDVELETNEIKRQLQRCPSVFIM